MTGGNGIDHAYGGAGAYARVRKCSDGDAVIHWMPEAWVVGAGMSRGNLYAQIA